MLTFDSAKIYKKNHEKNETIYKHVMLSIFDWISERGLFYVKYSSD